MKNILKKLIYIISILLIAAQFSFAQEAEEKAIEEKSEEKPVEENKEKKPLKMEEIVVTATRTEVRKRETGKSLTIITGEELEKRGKKKVSEALRDVPGLTIKQNSSFGGMTNVFIRGSKSGNILVLIDGIEVNDPMQIERGFNFGDLDTENIERIEIIRGPQSTLYGSDALGGVINIITKKGKGEDKVILKAEAGSYKTFRESISLFGGSKKNYYSFSVSRIDSDGTSKSTQDNTLNKETDKDGYSNTSVSSRLGANPFGKTWINCVFRFNESYTEVDDGAYQSDPNYVINSTQMNTGIQYKQPVFKWWEHTIGLSYMSILRKYRDKTDPVDTGEDINRWYEGSNRKAEWQHNIYIGKIDTITFGLEIEQERGSYLNYADYGSGPSTSQLDEQRITTKSYFAQNHLKLIKRIYITLGGRIDDHEEFGKHETYSASGSFIVPFTETQLKSNYAIGFKAPTIFQLYDQSNGNIDLKPEETKSYDVGFNQDFFKDRISIGATYFVNKFTNMIEWTSTGMMTGQYFNVGKAESSGYEGELLLKPVDSASITYAYTYQKTENKETGKELERRPRHQHSLNINWLLFKKMNLNLNGIYISKQNDVYYDASYNKNEVTTEKYYRINFFTSFKINDMFQIFGKVENITDKNYQTLYGYAQPGRSYYGGAKATF